MLTDSEEARQINATRADLYKRAKGCEVITNRNKLIYRRTFLGYVSLLPYTRFLNPSQCLQLMKNNTYFFQRGESIEPLQLALEIASQNDEELSWTPKGNITFRIRVSFFYSGSQ